MTQIQPFSTVVFAIYVVCTFVGARSAQDEKDKSYPVLSGVGIALQAKDGSLFASVVVPKSPADKSGLILAGARLVSVETNGETYTLDGKTVGYAASLIRGPVGTKLVLTVVPKDGDATIEVTLIREPLEFSGLEPTYKTMIGTPIGNLKLSSLDNKLLEQLSSYRGKIVVLDFWASWCPTCYAPVTKLQKLAANNPSWKGKVELMTVTVDSELSRARETIKTNNWNQTRNLAINVDDLNSIGVTVLPVVIVVAPDGTIASMAGAHALDVESEIASLLAD